MAFTSKLGISDSRPGNIVPGLGSDSSIVAAAGVWAFGGQASFEAPAAGVGIWEFSGQASGLAGGAHVASGAGVWEFSGEASGGVTDAAIGAGVWEFGGTCTIQEGTPEGCITADGSAEGDLFQVQRQANYVF